MGLAPLPKPGAPLSYRERQILRAMSYGQTNGEIGKALHVTENTVKSTAYRMFHKLGARDRAHATRLGLELGYLKPDMVNGPVSPSPATPVRGEIRAVPHLAACWTGAGCRCPSAVA